jgi:hypothetical protein
MKTVQEYNYLIASQILSNDIKQLSTTENSSETGVIAKSSTLTPEEHCLKQDSFDSLSEEAKSFILEFKKESDHFLSLVQTPKMRLYSKALILDLLKKQYYSDLIAQNIFNEIKNWVEQL